MEPLAALPLDPRAATPSSPPFAPGPPPRGARRQQGEHVESPSVMLRTGGAMYSVLSDELLIVSLQGKVSRIIRLRLVC